MTWSCFLRMPPPFHSLSFFMILSFLRTFQSMISSSIHIWILSTARSYNGYIVSSRKLYLICITIRCKLSCLIRLQILNPSNPEISLLSLLFIILWIDYKQNEWKKSRFVVFVPCQHWLFSHVLIPLGASLTLCVSYKTTPRNSKA